MKTSTDRILTTHVGSLPRSEVVTKGVFALENEETIDLEAHRRDPSRVALQVSTERSDAVRGRIGVRGVVERPVERRVFVRVRAELVVLADRREDPNGELPVGYVVGVQDEMEAPEHRLVALSDLHPEMAAPGRAHRVVLGLHAPRGLPGRVIHPEDRGFEDRFGGPIQGPQIGRR